MVQVGYEGGGGSVNVQGEEQKKLDVVTNDVLKRALAFTGKVGVIASEEEDAPVFNADAYKGPRVPGGEGKYQDVTVDIGSKYVTVFDPLDGSSNVRLEPLCPSLVPCSPATRVTCDSCAQNPSAPCSVCE